jgi:hypothetical protein
VNTERVRGVDYSPGCGDPECPCGRQGLVCEEFMGIPGEYRLSIPFCPRCGWHLKHHPAAEETP